MSVETKLCPFCGKEIKAVAIKCKYCGKFLNNNSENNESEIQNNGYSTTNLKSANNKLLFIKIFSILFAIFFAFGLGWVCQNKWKTEEKPTNQSQTIQQNTQEIKQDIKQDSISQANEKMSYSEILKQLEKYQAQYWEIIKRNNLLIDQNMEEETPEITKDREDLSKLFKIVESKIDKDNQYYKKLEIIEKQFENNDGETQYDMNNFAGVYNDTIDGLLNDIYKNIRATIPENDFTNLKLSERKWLKDIESYKTVMNSEELGSMGSMTKAYAIADMRKFRILLLLLYYNN